MDVVTGGCACGGVRYEVRGPLRDIIACHCEQCRRTSGHFVAATACRSRAFSMPGTLDEPQGLKIAHPIFVAEAGDYYALESDVPKSADGTHNVQLP